jgi:hypothetical protein
MRDFWISCGHHLLDRAPEGGLVVTDAFLKAYLARPELMPPPEACAAERALHAALLADPRRRTTAAEIAAIVDPDARDNFTTMMAFRERLLDHDTIEAAYRDLMLRGVGATPPLFVDQLVHLILRNALDLCTDVQVLRAAELMFRRQRVTSLHGSLLAADEEIVAARGAAPVSPLVAMLGLPEPDAIDVLGPDNEASYWQRSDRFDFALDLTAGRRGLAALGEVIAVWVRHLVAVDISIEPIIAATDVDFTWYVGLDAEATAIGDALWHGRPLDDAARQRIVALYRVTVADRDLVLDRARDCPIYLIAAITPDGKLRLKPQNLLTGLPIRRLEAVS